MGILKKLTNVEWLKLKLPSARAQPQARGLGMSKRSKNLAGRYEDL